MDKLNDKIRGLINPERVVESVEEPVVSDELAGTRGTVVTSEDVNKWGMETEPLLDKIYHKLLGEVENDEGLWVRDESISRIMNELGASELIQELRIRFNINMQMSELKMDDVKRICSDTGKVFADKLEDNWVEWSVNPAESTMRGICKQLVDSLFIFLCIPLNGGMKRHREKRGVKNYYNPGGIGMEGAF